MHSETGEIEENLDRTRQLSFEASEKGAHFICFPELSVTGYTLKSLDRIYNGGFDTHGVLERLSQIARETEIAVIAGLVEFQAREKPFISQAIIGPEGVIGVYRKTHLSPMEKPCYREGLELPVFTWAGITFGIQLCYEAHFPEISGSMALMGADVLFLPHASPRGEPEEKLDSWLRHLPGRAFDNGVFVVACNQVGKTSERLSFPGVALVVGPDGRLLAHYAEATEGMLITTLKGDTLSEVRKHRMRYFLPHRRPGLYHRIVGACGKSPQ
jgi:N-carbamoylputrescine amidase